MALLGALLLTLFGTALARTHESLATLPRQGDVHARLLQTVGGNYPNPHSGELASNQTLLQNTPLYSQDGTVYLMQQSNGALTLFNTAGQNTIYSTSSSSGTFAPYYTIMQLDCNLCTYDAKGTLVYQSGTTAVQENPDVTPPCRTVVEGTGGGFIAIIDSFASGDQSDTVLFTRPNVGNGIMLEGQTLPQNVRLYSPDGLVFINTQADGNLVLYNAAKKAANGANAETAVTSTATYGQSQNAPFELDMQTDYNLVLYKLVNTTGKIPANIIYQSYTSGAGTGCQLIVSSQQGGVIFIVDSANQVLFELPRVPNNTVSTVPPPTTMAPPSATPTPGTLFANQNLPMNTELFSPDGAVYLVAQGDGNLVLYNTALVKQYGQGAISAIYNSATSASGTISLNMQPDCNLVLYANGAPIYYSATYGQGSTCKMIVSSANGGYFAVLNPSGTVIFQRPTPPPPPPTTRPALTSSAPPSTSKAPPSTTPVPTSSSQYGSGILASGQVLQQGPYLYSSDGKVYIVVQADGNLVLYNSTLVAAGVPAYQAAIYQTATYGSNSPPYFLAMQPDCNLVLYKSGTSSPSTALFQSNTYMAGAQPCHLLVSSASGGHISVVDNTGKVLFIK